eukprot:8555987-Lingulodinium_polyedra.AAC.2
MWQGPVAPPVVIEDEHEVGVRGKLPLESVSRGDVWLARSAPLGDNGGLMVGMRPPKKLAIAAITVESRELVRAILSHAARGLRH